MKDLIEKVIAWGEPKGLCQKGEAIESLPQYIKVLEEVNEIGKAISDDDRYELIDAIGDTQVTLILLAKQNGLTIEECLEAAYGVIKNRTGKTINGTFVKD